MKPDNKSQRGFTLIELMVVVVIVGILATIAYPTYQNHQLKTRRGDALIALTRTAADMEKFYAECSFYTSVLTGSRKCTDVTPGLGYSNNLSPSERYSLAITLSGSSYSITATPRLAQAKDTACTTLTLNGNGTKSATGSEASNCWRK